MPIEKPTKHSAPVFYPRQDFKLVKYLDLTKFLSLLQKQSLFFCRLDKLEDHFEGTTGIGNYGVRYNFFKAGYPDKEDAQIRKEVEQFYEDEKKMKSYYLVNCWNKNDKESAALWKIYSDFQKGIMIKSSVNKLHQALENTKQDILLSEIKYIDHNSTTMMDGNVMYPIIHKHIAYHFEQEIRLINKVEYRQNIETGYYFDWSKEETQTGRYLKTDLNNLIDEIIISPYAPNWFYEMVLDLTRKYGLEKVIKKSALSKTAHNNG